MDNNMLKQIFTGFCGKSDMRALKSLISNRNEENRYSLYVYVIDSHFPHLNDCNFDHFDGIIKTQPAGMYLLECEKWVKRLEKILFDWYEWLEDEEKTHLVFNSTSDDKLLFWKLVELIQIISNFEGSDDVEFVCARCHDVEFRLTKQDLF